MFIGEYNHSIDQKGRLQIPAKFRKNLKGGVVVTRGLDRCLWLYSRTEWGNVAEKLAQLPISQKRSRAFARLMLAGAWDAEVDSQGRIMVPEYLRQYAGMDKATVVAGLYNKIEVWDASSWQRYKAEAEKNSEEIAEGMAELGV